MANVLLINVETQSVGNLVVSNNEDILDAIGNGATSCDMYKLPNGDYLVYDMQGFFQPPVGGFVHNQMNWLLMSNACVIGYDPQTAQISDCVSNEIDTLNNVTYYDATYCAEAQK